MAQGDTDERCDDAVRQPPRDVVLGRLALSATVLVLLLLLVVVAFAVVITRRGPA